MDFQTALTNWLTAVETNILAPQINDKWVKDYGFKYMELITETGNKFIKIFMKYIQGGSTSAWAFVAIDDGFNSTLGKWKKGDIFKPASWRAPAKHARGNIFDLSNGPNCNITQWTGPNYLK